MKKISISMLINTFCVLIGLVIIAFTVQTIYHDIHPNSTVPSKSVDMNKEWYDKDGKKVVLSPFLSNKNIKFGETTSIFYDIKDNIKPGDSMCFRSLSTDFVAYIDGKEIIKPTYYPSIFSCHSTGSQWHFYTFKKDDIGKTIEVKLKFFYNDNASYFENVYACNSHEYVIHAITSRLSELIIALTILILGIFFIIIGLGSKRILHINKSMLSLLGLLLCTLSIWTILESHIVELLFNCSQIVQIFACNMLMLLPIAGILFIDNVIDSENNIIIKIACSINIILFIIAWLLQLTGFKDFHESLYLSFTSLFIAVVAVIIHIIRQRKKIATVAKTKYKSVIKILLIILIALSIVVDFINFFKNPQSTNGFFSRASSILVIGFCIFIALNNIISLAVEFIQANAIKNLAYKDVLTNVYNRTAYENKLKELEHNNNKHYFIGIAIFDINNLKHVNDNLGHELGDELIKATAELISRSFNTNSTIYRIGGDEFAVLIESKDARNIYKISSMEFKNQINNYNNYYNKPFTLSVAYGSAFYDKSTNIPLEEIIKMADKEMYKNKQEYKKTHI